MITVFAIIFENCVNKSFKKFNNIVEDIFNLISN